MGEKHNETPMASAKDDWRVCRAPAVDVDALWRELCMDARRAVSDEPELEVLLTDVILRQPDLAGALAVRMARKLARADMSREELSPLLAGVLRREPRLVQSAARDLRAIQTRDPACDSPLEPLLYFKGFLAITTYRVAHHLWGRGRKPLALYFQSLCSEIFAVDIHPAARIGNGVLLDHATSVVVGETAVVEDDVSILHEVTLGGTGKQRGLRHPVIRSGVLIGAGAKILGRVVIGEGAQIGAGSVVLQDVPPHKSVAGVPAVLLGESRAYNPALEMNQWFGEKL